MGPVPAHAKQGAPLKAWDSLGPLQKRRQSQKAFDEMKKAAQIRNELCTYVNYEGVQKWQKYTKYM